MDNNEIYKRAWEYFTQHANQRISMMNFYIIIELAILAGLVAAIGAIDIHNPIINVMGFSMIFFSVVFALLDSRSKEFVDVSANAIKEIERSEETDTNVKLFTQEAISTKTRRKKNIFNGLKSFTFLLRVIFVFFGVMGFLVPILGKIIIIY
jgi:hypothetical protein